MISKIFTDANVPYLVALFHNWISPNKKNGNRHIPVTIAVCPITKQRDHFFLHTNVVASTFVIRCNAPQKLLSLYPLYQID